MPLGDWIFGGPPRRGDGSRGAEDRFSGPPGWSDNGQDSFSGSGIDREMEGMMDVMDRMMSSMMGGFGIRFDDDDRQQEFDRFSQLSSPAPVHNQGAQPNRSLRHQFLRNEPPQDSTSSRADQEHAPAVPSTAHNVHVQPFTLDQRDEHDSLFPSSSGLRGGLLDGFPSLGGGSGGGGISFDFDRTSAGEPSGMSTSQPQSVVRSTVYSSSSVRRADGTVETKTYNRSPDGLVKTSHTRQLPDQRTLTTVEETAADGSVTTRDELASASSDLQPPADMDTFTSDWQSRQSLFSLSPRAFFSRPSRRGNDSDAPCTDCSKVPAGDDVPTSSSQPPVRPLSSEQAWNWARSWFR